MRIANPAPTRIRPSENLTGVDGSCPRRPSHSHSQANTGAKAQTNIEFIDWNQLHGYDHPRTVVRVSRSANRLRVEPACSNSDQNRAAARKNTPIAYSRLRSSGVQSPPRNSHPKNTTQMTSSR